MRCRHRQDHYQVLSLGRFDEVKYKGVSCGAYGTIIDASVLADSGASAGLLLYVAYQQLPAGPASRGA